MMDRGTLIAGGILGFGALFLLSHSGEGFSLFDSDLGANPYLANLTPAQRAQLAAGQLGTAGPGNAPAVGAAPSVSPAQIAGAIGGIGAAALPLLGVGGVALGIATAGIGLGVVLVSYALMKQRASMHTNDVRDLWQRQFIALHDALGLTPLTAAQTQGSGPGSIELAECIFAFDHDSTNSLWRAVAHTQDERVFRGAAANVDRFFAARGIPVEDVR